MLITFPNLPKTATRGDTAAAFIGYATGFVVDVFLFPLGIPPGTTAGVFMIGAVGVKNLIQISLGFRKKARKEAEAKEARKLELRHQCFSIEKHLEDHGAASLADEMKREEGLWDSGALNDDQFKDSMQKILDRFRGLKPDNDVSTS